MIGATGAKMGTQAVPRRHLSEPWTFWNLPLVGLITLGVVACQPQAADERATQQCRPQQAIASLVRPCCAMLMLKSRIHPDWRPFALWSVAGHLPRVDESGEHALAWPD
jgi:hypothetical protein